MDQLRVWSGKVQRLVRPGHAGDAQAGTQTGAGHGVMVPVGEYKSWSGLTSTIHTRLLLGITGHGLGAELL
jgi:hypothetical protein